MGNRPTLSRGELEIARVLWEIGPATVRQLHDAIKSQRDIDFATVQTYLRRLDSKGYAVSKLSGRLRVYSAKTKPRTVIRETVDDLVNRLFGGDTMPLVRHLIEERGMDRQDLEELRSLVDRLDQTTSDKETE